MRRALAALLLLSAAPLAAQNAATPEAGGAEAVVAEYVRAFATRDYAEAAGHLDPDELAEFAGLLVTLTHQAAEDGGPGLFSIDPDAPPADVFADFLASTTRAEPLMDEALESLRASVVGSVAEGDSLRHVVVRSQFDLAGAPTGGVQLTTARWTGSRWVVTFDARMKQFKAQLDALANGPQEGGGDG